MFQLIYVSSAVDEFSSDELKSLLEVARKNNDGLGITGMLLYKDGNFMQLLEGERKHVESIHEKITNDPRHRGLLTLLRAEIVGRDFSGWSMGFKDLRTAAADYPEGYSTFLNSNFRDNEFAENPSRARKLLMTFKRSM